MSTLDRKAPKKSKKTAGKPLVTAKADSTGQSLPAVGQPMATVKADSTGQSQPESCFLCPLPGTMRQKYRIHK